MAGESLGLPQRKGHGDCAPDKEINENTDKKGKEMAYVAPLFPIPFYIMSWHVLAVLGFSPPCDIMEKTS